MSLAEFSHPLMLSRVRLTNLKFSLTENRAFVIAFFLGFAFRLIPEIVSYPHPIGFDTIYYAWRIRQGVVWFHWSEGFSSWLLYGLLIPIYDFLQVDSFLLLKLAAPLLFGLNTCGIYFFARKVLGWDLRRCLFAAFFFSFQISSLAISWHFYRNMLGSGILLFTLPFVKNNFKRVREFFAFALLSVLVVLSHELVSVVLFAVVFGVMLNSFLKGAKAVASKVFAAAAPSIAIFLTRIYFVLFPVSYYVETNIIRAYQPLGHYSGVFWFFTNYLGVSDTVQCYPTYLDLFCNVASMFVLLYVVFLPLVLVGFFRDRVLDSWTVLLLFGSFGALVVPWFALDLWNRWMLMVIYPFTFYAVNGVMKVLSARHSTVNTGLRWLKWVKVSKRMVKTILAFSFSLGLVFMVCPLFFGKSGVFCLPTTVCYVPSTMQCNSLPLMDVDGAVKALEWLNVRMDGHSVLLGQDAFFWWARLCVSNSHTVVYFDNDFEEAISLAFQHGFNRVFFVWWNVDIGWHGITVPNYFFRLCDFGRISVYEYVG